VNNLLRNALDGLAKNYPAVVIDNEAGMEHLSRRTTNDVDALIVMMNPTLPSLRAARRILALSRELPIKVGRRMVLVNRVGPDGVPEEVRQELVRLDGERLPDVPQDNGVEQAGAVGRDVMSLAAETPALAVMKKVAETLRQPKH
jgi:CO dehydrogenase maturation factor